MWSSLTRTEHPWVGVMRGGREGGVDFVANAFPHAFLGL